MDSAYLVYFERARAVLETEIKSRFSLTLTQFRLLLEVADDGRAPRTVSSLAKALDVKPNVASQASTGLEARGLVSREVSDVDARSRSIRTTPEGRREVERIDAGLAFRLDREFNPESDELFRKSLTAAVYALDRVEGPFSDGFREDHAAAMSMLVLMEMEQRIIAALEGSTGASLNECRVIQRIHEVDAPMRGVDLATQLDLPPTTITRAATRLEKRDWLVRFASSEDFTAVFLGLTEQGDAQAIRVGRLIDETAEREYWGRLDAEGCRIMKALAEIYAERIRAADSVRMHADIGVLTKIR